MISEAPYVWAQDWQAQHWWPDSLGLWPSGHFEPSVCWLLGTTPRFLHCGMAGSPIQLEGLGIYDISLKPPSRNLGNKAVNQLNCNPGSDFCPCQDCFDDTAQAWNGAAGLEASVTFCGPSIATTLPRVLCYIMPPPSRSQLSQYSSSYSTPNGVIMVLCGWRISYETGGFCYREIINFTIWRGV